MFLDSSPTSARNSTHLLSKKRPSPRCVNDNVSLWVHNTGSPACVCTCMYVCMYVQIYCRRNVLLQDAWMIRCRCGCITQAVLHVYVRECMYVCMYVCIYVCMCTQYTNLLSKKCPSARCVNDKVSLWVHTTGSPVCICMYVCMSICI
jgi:hypothetical protein